MHDDEVREALNKWLCSEPDKSRMAYGGGTALDVIKDWGNCFLVRTVYGRQGKYRWFQTYFYWKKSGYFETFKRAYKYAVRLTRRLDKLRKEADKCESVAFRFYGVKCRLRCFGASYRKKNGNFGIYYCSTKNGKTVRTEKAVHANDIESYNAAFEHVFEKVLKMHGYDSNCIEVIAIKPIIKADLLEKFNKVYKEKIKLHGI